MSTADQQLAIGIDVGGTTIKGVLADTRGNIIATSEAVATPRTGAEDVVAAAARLARTLREDSPEAPVGVCVPGIINEEQGIGIFSANLGWKDAPLGDMLSQALDSFVPLGHDVRSGALAEALWGVRCSSCLYVAVGTGIASGVVINSRLVLHGQEKSVRSPSPTPTIPQKLSPSSASPRLRGLRDVQSMLDFFPRVRARARSKNLLSPMRIRLTLPKRFFRLR